MAVIRLTEAQAERMADAAVMRALSTDPRYVNAESSEDQSIAEAEIAAEVWQRIEGRFSID